ncbi:MAG: hypothetical protein HQ559_09270 [Lentisphaerae bacterium]|nr:hypothetical protein [Lentisphaerota bacterium]
MNGPRTLLPVFAVALLGCAVSAAPPGVPADPDLPSIEIVELVEAPVIDGRLDDPCWTTARQSEPFADEYAFPVHAETTFRIGQKDDVLYLAIRARYDEKGGKRTENTKVHDGSFWQGEEIEFFIDPDMDDTPGYYQFALTTYDVRGDFFCPEPGDSEGRWEPEYRVKSQWSETEWTIEYAIPLTCFDRTDTVYENFGFNLFRNDPMYWDIATWAPSRGEGFHFPHKFGEVRGLKGKGVKPNEAGRFRSPYIKVNDRVIRAKADPTLVPERAPVFVKDPEVRARRKSVDIRFEANTHTDVAVWIEDDKGETVRHLVAGLLGANAPPPLAKNSLAQRLRWDYANNEGVRVPAGRYHVKLGLRSQARLDRVIGWDPSPKEIVGIAPGNNGDMVVVSGIRDEWLEVQRFDRDGNYLETLYPPPGDLPPEKLKGMNIIDYGKDGQVRFGSHRLAAWLPHLDQPMPHTPLVNRRGQIIIFGGEYMGGPSHFYKINADGSLPDDFLGPYVKETLWTQYYDRWAKRFHFALDPDDEDVIYLSGLKELHRSEYSDEGKNKRETYYNAVMRVTWGRDAPLETFVGTRTVHGLEGGNGPDEFQDPQGICFDRRKNLWVCDRGNNRIQVFDRKGRLVASLAHPRPYEIRAALKSDTVYVLGSGEGGAGISAYSVEDPSTPTLLARTDALGRESYWRTMILDETGKAPELKIVRGELHAWRVDRFRHEGDRFEGPELILGKHKPRQYERVTASWETDVVYGGGHWFDGATGEYIGKRTAGDEIVAVRDGTWAVRSGFVGESITYYPADWPFSAAQKPLRRWEVLPTSLNRNKKNGFCVAPNGDVYVARYYQWQGQSSGRVGMEGSDLHMAVDHYAPDGTMRRQRVLYELSHAAHGPAVDIRGNIYVVDNIGRAIGRFYEDDIAANLPSWVPDYEVDWDMIRAGKPIALGYQKFVKNPLIKSIGAVYKFGPGGGGVIWREPQGSYHQYTPEPGKQPHQGKYLDWGYPSTPRPDRPATHWQATWVTTDRLAGMYPVWHEGVEWEFLGVGPAWGRYNKGHSSCCCVTCRIAVDDFGRVYAPAPHRSTIRMLDTAGNEILRIGRYGNMDAHHPDNPDPAIAFRFPAAVALSKRYLYATELRDARILKIALDYERNVSKGITVK